MTTTLELQQQLAAKRAEKADAQRAIDQFIREQARPAQARSLAVLSGQAFDSTTIRHSYGELQAAYARVSSECLELERRIRPPEPIQYHHSPEERERLARLAADPDLRESAPPARPEVVFHQRAERPAQGQVWGG